MASVKYVTSVAAGAALGGFLFGFDTSSMNAALAGIRTTLSLGAGTTGFVAAIVLIGCALGAWFAGPVSERLGRTRVMSLAGLLLTAGSLGAALTGGVPVLGLARLVSGLGIGAASAVVPSYVAEISPASIRGRLGTFWQFAIVFGQFLGLLVGQGLTRWAGSEAAPLFFGASAWRWMFVVVALAALAYAVLTRRLPVSPVDLLRHGREDEAKALLGRLTDAPVATELEAVRASLAKGRRTTLRDLRGPRFGLAGIVWSGILLAAFQQLVGINVVKTYSNTLWKAVGFTTNQAFGISLLTVAISIAATVVAIALMDKVGRRTLLVSGAAVMALSLVALALSFSTASGSGAEVSLGGTAGVVALVAMNVFAVAFGVSWGPVMWLMLGELFDSRLRTTAVAVCTALNWMTNWAVTRTFPLLAGEGLELAYGLYAAFAVGAFLFALVALPETRGRELS